jgi:hypothetical protein
MNSLASSDFTEQHATVNELQWSATLPAVFQAAMPSANFNYKSPSHRSQPLTSNIEISANESCVFTMCFNKSAYLLQPSINYGDTPHS